MHEQMTYVHGEKACMHEQPDHYIHGHICGSKYDKVNTHDLILYIYISIIKLIEYRSME